MPKHHAETTREDPAGSIAEDAIVARITKARETLGSRVVILCHHYQPDVIVQFADHVGDSLNLSRLAASRKEARYIVFCGVYFMAETADILSSPEQEVYMPDPDAGCPMADMARLEQVERCWSELTRLVGETIVPITYVNSSAEIKQFCGRRNGVVCTSSNAAKVMDWAFEQAPRVLFLPDQNLGRNTALAKGISKEEIALWNRGKARLQGDLDKAKVILWDGFCPVHVRFTPEQVMRFRSRYPGIRIIVHPECTEEVVRLADGSGSTEYLIREVREAESGSVFAVGTELRLVKRLAATFPDRTVYPLDEEHSICVDMSRSTPERLLAVLEGLLEGRAPGRIQVPAETAEWSRVALERMLAIS